MCQLKGVHCIQRYCSDATVLPSHVPSCPDPSCLVLSCLSSHAAPEVPAPPEVLPDCFGFSLRNAKLPSCVTGSTLPTHTYCTHECKHIQCTRRVHMTRLHRPTLRTCLYLQGSYCCYWLVWSSVPSQLCVDQYSVCNMWFYRGNAKLHDLFFLTGSCSV